MIIRIGDDKYEHDDVMRQAGGTLQAALQAPAMVHYRISLVFASFREIYSDLEAWGALDLRVVTDGSFGDINTCTKPKTVEWAQAL